LLEVDFTAVLRRRRSPASACRR